MATESCIRLVILTNGKPHQACFVDALARRFAVKAVVVENDPERPRRLAWRRLRRLGIGTMCDQALYLLLERLIFKRRSARRLREILGETEPLIGRTGQDYPVVVSRSVNSPEVIDAIRQARPDLVVVSGTSILKPETLAAIGAAPTLNIHCGITPRYRGTHGAFWAVVNGDWANAGTTVHFVDAGIDTGGILEQGIIEPAADDDPRTLVYRQYQRGIELMGRAIERVAAGDLSTRERPDLDSRIYSSPTFSSYLRFRQNLRRR